MRPHATWTALAAALTLAGAAALGTETTLACCMVPRTYEGTIGQSLQEALIFHANGREDLVLRIHYEISPKAGAKKDEKAPKGLPDNFAWIITVPNEPDSYAVSDEQVFKDAFELYESKRPVERNWAKGGVKPQALGEVELGKRVRVGPYDIQPVRAVGKDAFAGLNAWLEKNGFPSEDEKHMAWFIENKFTFLCVKVVKDKDAAQVDAKGGLDPLHLSFKSEKVYYPLRFSSRQGVFDVLLHVFTAKPVKDDDAKAWKPYLERVKSQEGLVNFEVTQADFKGKLAELVKNVKAGEKVEKWYLNQIHGVGFNTGPTAISTWSDDFLLAMK